eukprot:1191029-Prorocentrum_minimum.AAC.2
MPKHLRWGSSPPMGGCERSLGGVQTPRRPKPLAKTSQTQIGALVPEGFADHSTNNKVICVVCEKAYATPRSSSKVQGYFARLAALPPPGGTPWLVFARFAVARTNVSFVQKPQVGQQQLVHCQRSPNNKRHSPSVVNCARSLSAPRLPLTSRNPPEKHKPDQMTPANLKPHFLPRLT